LLSGASGALGGFSYPEDFRNAVVRPRPGFAVVRGLARVMPTNGDTLVMPRVVSGTDPYSSGVSGAWRSSGYVSGGTAPPVQNQPTLAQERIAVHWWQPNAIELDPSLIDDNAINLEGVIGEELGRTKGLDEDSAFVNGTGVGQPLGLRNAGFTAVTLGNDTVSYSTLIDLTMGVPAQYRASATHLMRSSVFGAYMKLETSSGVALIFPGYARFAANNATPAVANLQGYPVAVTEFMPALANTTGVHLFGDFFYYVIAERQDLRVQRLVERFAPNVGILVSARVGGQPVLNDAFRMGTTS
jgi:HK97 family phage major capsid protein